ncbi:uncharacterized protein LOC136036514 [Artemia franciscana]
MSVTKLEVSKRGLWFILCFCAEICIVNSLEGGASLKKHYINYPDPKYLPVAHLRPAGPPIFYPPSGQNQRTLKHFIPSLKNKHKKLNRYPQNSYPSHGGVNQYPARPNGYSPLPQAPQPHKLLPPIRATYNTIPNIAATQRPQFKKIPFQQKSPNKLTNHQNTGYLPSIPKAPIIPSVYPARHPEKTYGSYDYSQGTLSLPPAVSIPGSGYQNAGTNVNLLPEGGGGYGILQPESGGAYGGTYANNVPQNVNSYGNFVPNSVPNLTKVTGTYGSPAVASNTGYVHFPQQPKTLKFLPQNYLAANAQNVVHHSLKVGQSIQYPVVNQIIPNPGKQPAQDIPVLTGNYPIDFPVVFRDDFEHKKNKPP